VRFSALVEVAFIYAALSILIGLAVCVLSRHQKGGFISALAAHRQESGEDTSRLSLYRLAQAVHHDAPVIEAERGSVESEPVR
jgi:hypothetical protein